MAQCTEHLLLTADGVKLAARSYLPVSSATHAAVVIAHGFTGSKDQEEVVALAAALRAEGFAVVSYDSRGHGASGGMCTLGDLEELDVAAAAAQARNLDERVVLIGASMGGIAVLRHAAKGPQISGVVVVSSPAAWQVPLTPSGMTAAFLAGTPAGRRVTYRRTGTRVSPQRRSPEPPGVLVARATVPVAVVHGRGDWLVRPRAARRLYGCAQEPRMMRVVPGMGHAFGCAAIVPITEAVRWVLSRPPAER